MKYSSVKFGKIIAVIVAAWISVGASAEFYNVAWGTGEAVGQFSLRWGILFVLFILLVSTALTGGWVVLFHRKKIDEAFEKIISLRKRFSTLRWLLAILLLAFPVWFLQRTIWGIVFNGIYFRLFLWALTVFLLAGLFTRGNNIMDWKPFLAVLILTSSVFTIAISLQGVIDYPFSQGWSEGNRLWDYSVLFGRDQYDYPPDKEIPVYLDFGRKLIGGIPFLFSGVGIFTARLWIGLIQIFPYFLLGLAFFRFEYKNKIIWLLLMLWSFLFLKQGPIHPPLVICAAMVALAWRTRLWIAVPLVLGAGYFAQASRFTWVLAPGIWIFMLEIASASFSDRKSALPVLKRALLLGALGIFGGLFLSGLVSRSQDLIQHLLPPMTISAPVITTPTPSPPEEAVPAPEGSVKSYPPIVDFFLQKLTFQPLLWYRLLPNATYGSGILFGLAFAVLPILIILVWLYLNGNWILNNWQKIAILGPLTAFLVVGLIVSTKIGGGGDLHNLDMFMIGLLFTVALAWFHGGREWVLNAVGIPDMMKVVLVFSIINSSLAPLQSIRSFYYTGNIEYLAILTDTENPRSLDILPSEDVVEQSLQMIKAEVELASGQGDVLFMDQRQLLTFGYITNVVLVPEYEKKLLMDKAMGNDFATFEPFYIDLAAHRFSLIVTEPLKLPIKDFLFQFGEENNAWVKWVSIPVLCYYEPKVTLQEVGVQLLVPKQDTSECAEILPKE